jgi:hypothetical protein
MWLEDMVGKVMLGGSSDAQRSELMERRGIGQVCDCLAVFYFLRLEMRQTSSASASESRALAGWCAAGCVYAFGCRGNSPLCLLRRWYWYLGGGLNKYASGCEILCLVCLARLQEGLSHKKATE